MTAAAHQKAVADVLSCIASDLATVGELLAAAVQAGEESKDAMLVACSALVAACGSLADRAARACGDSGCKSADSWMYAPIACDALELLESRR